MLTTQQTRECPGCGKPLAQDKYDVCFSDETCPEYCLHDRACYRYLLQARVSAPTGGETCLFLMLNPSTANESKPDPTVTRCKRFAEQWGCRRLWVCNLFAVRGPDANEALSHLNPVGTDNDRHIQDAARQAGKIVLAWGDSGINALGRRRFLDRVQDVAALLGEASASEKLSVLVPPGRPCLTVAGQQPRHPNPQNPLDMPVGTTECKRVQIGSDGTLTIAG